MLRRIRRPMVHAIRLLQRIKMLQALRHCGNSLTMRALLFVGQVFALGKWHIGTSLYIALVSFVILVSSGEVFPYEGGDISGDAMHFAAA